MSGSTDVAIVGAGPYGLSIAAHLAAAGVGFRIFGTPMRTWRAGMPEGMKLKSEGFASSLSDPGARYTLAHHCRDRGLPYADINWPVPVEVFAEYGEAFQRRFVPQLDTRNVTRVAPEGEGYRVEIEGGETLGAKSVVMATGIGAYAKVPQQLAGLPSSSLTHSSDHADYSAFAGRAVAVIGAGASALDAAAALRRAGAAVTLVTRSSKVRFYEGGRPRRRIDALLAPLTPLGPGWKKLLCCEAPLLFHALPAKVRAGIVQRYLGPSPGWFVREAIEGHVPYCLNSTVEGARVREDGRVNLEIERGGNGRETLVVDHVVAATGYKVDVARLNCLDAALLPRLATLDLSPVLSRDFESSVPGLYFVGTPSAYSFGPMFRFACGADYAARRLTARLVAQDRMRGRARGTPRFAPLAPLARASRS